MLAVFRVPAASPATVTSVNSTSGIARTAVAHPVGQHFHRRQARALRRAHGDVELRLIVFRREVDGRDPEERDAREQHQHGANRHQPAMRHRPLEQRACSRDRADRTAGCASSPCGCVVFRLRLEPVRRHHRREREADKQRHDHRERHRQAEALHEAAHDAAHEADRRRRWRPARTWWPSPPGRSPWSPRPPPPSAACPSLR